MHLVKPKPFTISLEKDIAEKEIKDEGFNIGIKVHWAGNPVPPGGTSKPIDSIPSYEIVSLKNWRDGIGEAVLEDPDHVEAIAGAPINTKLTELDVPMAAGVISVKKIAFTLSPENISKFAKGGAIYEGHTVKIKDTGKKMKITDISKNKKDQVEFTGKHGTYLIGDIEKASNGGKVKTKRKGKRNENKATDSEMLLGGVAGLLLGIFLGR